MPVLNNALAGAAGSGGDAGFQIKRSLRFDHAGDAAYLERNYAGGNRQVWTWSGWVKRSGSGWLFVSGSDNEAIYFNGGHLVCSRYSGSFSYYLETEASFEDNSAWYHICVVHNHQASSSSERVKVFVNGVRETQFKSGASYPGPNAEYETNDNNAKCRVGRYLNGYLAEVHFLDGQTPTINTDNNLGTITGVPNAEYLGDFGEFDENSVWQPKEYTGSYGTLPGQPNGFYLKFENASTSGTLGEDSSGRNNHLTPYGISNGVNNVNITGYTVTSGPGTGPNDAALSFNGVTNNGNYAHGFGTHYVHITTSSNPIAVTSTDTLTIYWSTSSTNPRDADLELVIGGTAYTYTTFTNTGQGNVQSNTVTIGQNGSIGAIKLNEASASSPGELHIRAIALNGTMLVGNAEMDQMLDSPSNYDDGANVGGNYATLQPYCRHTGTLSKCNLRFVASPDSSRNEATIAVKSGKYYWEAKAITNMQTHTIGGRIGICQSNRLEITNAENVEFDVDWHANAGVKVRRQGQSAVSLASGVNYDDGDLIGVALNADDNIVKFYKNGTLAYTIDFSEYLRPGSEYLTAHAWGYFSSTWDYNFGQTAFAQSVPSGYKTLCTQNLPDSYAAIADGTDHMHAVAYTGNGGSKVVQGTSFKPGMVWLKERGSNYSHFLHDANRGGTKAIFPNNPNVEHDYSPSGVTSFNTDGFTVNGAYAANYNNVNYISWNWKAGTRPSNSTYNQSEVWSSKLSTYQNSFGSEPVTNLFDGDTSTSFYSSSTSGSGIKFVPTTSITGSIELYLRNGDTANSTFSYSLDNGSSFTDLTTTAGNGSYVSIGNQTISNTNGIIVRHVTTAGTNAVNWRAIKVDNKVLVDDGLIPAGSLNDSVYNSSRVWSDDWSENVYYSTYGPTRVFDGNQSTGVAVTYPSTSTTINISPAISGSIIRVYYSRDSAAVASINGSETLPATTNSATYAWHTLTATSISSITLAHDNSGSSYIRAIEVDGKILLDDQVTPTDNFPDIPSTVLANPEAGFSIVKWIGNSQIRQNIGHGLNSTPEFIFGKNLENGSVDWAVYTKDLGPGGWIKLNRDVGYVGSTGVWGNLYPNSSIFYVSNDGEMNQNTKEHVAFCFSPVEGFSAMGTYHGDATSSSPFIYTGFRPAFLMHKRTDSNAGTNSGDWRIWDDTRDPYNPLAGMAKVNGVVGESRDPAHNIDFYSNGFRIRTSDGNINGNAIPYFYIAFAENPFKTARAR